MPVIADNGTILSIEGTWTNGQPFVNTFFYHRIEASPQEAARDVLNNWQDHIVPLFINNYSVQGIRFLDINELDGITGFLPVDDSKPKVGPGTTATSPPALSMLVKKVISGKRSARAGRLYLPPPQENEMDENGVLLASRIAAVDAGFESFRAGTDDDGGVGDNAGYIAVLHQFEGKPVSWSKVQSYKTQPLLGTQRRRMR